VISHQREEEHSRSKEALCSRKAGDVARRGNRFCRHQWCQRPCPPNRTNSWQHRILASLLARSSVEVRQGGFQGQNLLTDTSWAGTKLRTRRRMLMTTCSATDTTLEPETLDSLSMTNMGKERASSYLQNLYSALDSGIEIDVVGSYASGDTDFEVLCLD
jgi:hypothetical protein